MGRLGTRRLVDSLTAVGDALWPVQDGGTERRPGIPLYPLVTLTIAVVLVLRRIDGITNPQFWAEDGTVFFQQNLELGCRAALHAFFRGFPYLEQRLVACAATPVRFAHVPLVYSLVAYLVAAGSLATFALPWFRHVVRSDALRAVFCLAVAGAAQAHELVGNLTNTAWFLGIWLVLMTVARLPRAFGARAALACAVCVATFSTPLVVVTVPLWLARALHAVRRGRHGDAGFAALAIAGAAALVAIAGDLGRDDQPVQGLASPLLNMVALRVLSDAALGEARIDGVATQLGVWVVYAAALAMVIGLGAVVHRRERPILPVLLFCAYGIVAANVLTLGAHPLLAIITAKPTAFLQSRTWVSERYVFLPVALLYLACIAAVDRLPAQRRPVAVAVLVAWIVLSQARTFALPAFYDLQWAAEAANLERNLAEHRLEPLYIPVNPDPVGLTFNIAVNHRTPAPEVAVRPQMILGPLLNGATFEQTFVARCANLSEIDVMFAREGSAATQTVQIRLLQADTRWPLMVFVRNGSAVAVHTRDKETRAANIQRAVKERGGNLGSEDIHQIAAVAQEMEPFYFPPIHDSEGKRYVIGIAATGGEKGDAVSVYASAGDDYFDGAVYRNGSALGRDLVFRYGCSAR